MPTITVQAADSATAMDEIWEKLGPDAMIISTSKRNGRGISRVAYAVVSVSSLATVDAVQPMSVSDALTADGVSPLAMVLPSCLTH